MESRTQIQIKDGESVVCFYGHSASPFVYRRLHHAMSRRLRWNNASYLGRIIWDSFCPIAGGELGYGIGGSAMMGRGDLDNMVVVDIDKQEISLHQIEAVIPMISNEFDRIYYKHRCFAVYTFSEFAKLNPDDQTKFGWAIWVGGGVK